MGDAAAAIRGALAASSALGELGAATASTGQVGQDDDGGGPVADALCDATLSARAGARLVAGAALSHWCEVADDEENETSAVLPLVRPPPRTLGSALAALAADPPPYDEAARARAAAAAASAAFVQAWPGFGEAAAAVVKAAAADAFARKTISGPADAATVVPPFPADAPAAARPAAAALAAAEVERAAVEAALHCACVAALAAGCVRVGGLPVKISTVIQPLMACLRRGGGGVAALNAGGGPNSKSNGGSISAGAAGRPLRRLAAAALAEVAALATTREPCPNPRMVANICSMATGDRRVCARADDEEGSSDEENDDEEGEEAAAARNKGGGRGRPPAKKNQPLQRGASTAAAAAASALENNDPETTAAAAAAAAARRGGEAALSALAARFGPRCLSDLPSLPAAALAPLEALSSSAPSPSEQPPSSVGDDQALLDALCLLRTVGPALALAGAPGAGARSAAAAAAALRHRRSRVRRSAALAAAALSAAAPAEALPTLLRAAAECLLPSSPDAAREGGVALAAALTAKSENGSAGRSRSAAAAATAAFAPAAAALAVPLMRAAADPLPRVRHRAARALATAVALLPLAVGQPKPSWVAADEALSKNWDADAPLLSALVDGNTAPPPALSRELEAALRPYQVSGVAWMAFLRGCGLHGVLADDMGLGKTLQTAVAICCSADEAEKNGAAKKPSLVVCPTTLVGHWPAEIAKHAAVRGRLRVLAYEGPPAVRAALRPQVDVALGNDEKKKMTDNEGGNSTSDSSESFPDVVVMSYDTLRADADWISKHKWRYAVLDEGHAIRNPKSRISVAARRAVVAEHRLILSGTPIQNDVRELWALFSWLMPGFLGRERDFHSRYGRALDDARGAAASSKRSLAASAAALLSVADLHKQVMPFILRRTKDAVLRDLPPKSVQDVVLEPSAAQRALLDAFEQGGSGGGAVAALAQAAAGAGGGDANHLAAPGVAATSASAAASTVSAAAPAFRALFYLRKLCTSPALVLDSLEKDPGAAAALAGALGLAGKGGGKGGGLTSIKALASALAAEPTAHAPKLAALRQLLVDCGIIARGAGGGADDEDGVGGGGGGGTAGAGGGGKGEMAWGHRVLVFAQLRSTLDLVESGVLRPAGVPFLRLDGGVPAAKRFGVAAAFEADPTVPVLLLTTHVGGLGLNLTAADTVVFLEHDWNPMKDMQAMDRAHRLGQTRPVSVYRLLVKGTLEERVLSLQRFKLDVAAAVVNADNVSLAAMDTGRLLDSLGGDGGRAAGDGKATARATGDAASAAVAAVTAATSGGGGAGGKGMKAALVALEELWDDAQYQEEYDVDAFVAKVAAGKGGGRK